jgi:MSHA biogenesis protein MshQ
MRARYLIPFLAAAALAAPLPAAAQCTNCTTTTSGGDVIHTWTTGAGTFTVPAGVTNVDVLVVGGGGGGGFPQDRTGGGGGAGGLIYNAAFAVAGTINVTVGAAGTGGVGAGGATAGGNSVFGALTAIGGGRGGTGPAAGGVFATSGGSGGGGYHNPADSGKAGTGGQGNAGGSGWDSADVNIGFKAGGGGGAGSAGTTATAGVNGTGGAGVQNSISGASLFYAGGGGGGIQVYTGTILGGSGVGGNGGANGTAGTAGSTNRGAGGGGGSRNITTNVAGNGGNGGSGVVVVRYAPVTFFSRASNDWSNPATWSLTACGGAASPVIPTAAANVTICLGHTVTVDTASAANSVTFQAGNTAINLTHDVGQSLTVGAGGVTFNGATGGTITKAWNINAGSATVNGPVTMNGGSNNNRIVRINLTTGTLDINGDLTMTAGDDERAVIAATGAANIFLSGDFNFNNGTLTPGPSSTFTYDGPGGYALAHSDTIQYRNLVVNKPGGTSTQNGSTLTVLGDLDVQAGTLNIGTASADIDGATTVGGTLGITSTTGTKTFNGDVTINASGTWSNTANEAITMGASLTNNGTFDSGTGQYSFTTSTTAVWAGTSGLNFGGNVSVQASRTNNTSTSVAGTLSLNAGVTVTNNGTVTATGSITGANATTSIWTNAAGSTLNAGNALLTTGILNASAANNTVHYTGAGQTIKTPSGNDYYNLSLSGSGTKASGANLTILGDLAITGVTFSGGAFVHTVNGNITNTGTHTATSGRIVLAGGSAPHVLAGTGTYENLELNDAQGASLTANATIDSVLTLTNGVMTTAANTVFTNANCPGSVSRSNGWIAGNLRLRTPAGGTVTCVFHVGDATAYRPVSVTFTTLSAAGNVTGSVSQSAIDSPNIGSSTFDPLFTANRYWTIANAGANFASATATFTYAADVDPGVDEAEFIVGRFATAAWTYLTANPGSGSAQATGLSAATLSGEFQVGEQAAAPFSHWRMDQTAGWNGTANEVIDSGTGSGGPFHGTAAGLASTTATTAGATPAIPGTPGTCQYGVFTRANKNYIAIPAGFPNLTSAAGAFSIAGWIRTTDNAQAGQRIFVDDQGNVTPGGWAFSLGDGGAGTLRFFYRDGTAFILDTPSVVANGTWYYAAVVVTLAGGANASRATIYVYNTAGAQLAASTNTFTWNAGADGGPAAIGGETNAAGENTNAFGFSGNIDEMRVYRRALSAQRINQARQETRPCTFPPTVDHYELTMATSSIACLSTAVTVTACADTSSPCTNKVLTLAGQTASLTQSAGILGVTPVTFNAGGDATTTLSHPGAADGTPVTVTLSGESTAAANPRKCCPDGASCVIANSCSTTFNTAGFIFSSAANGAVATVPAQVAGVASSQLYLRAVRTSTTTKACESPLSGAATYPVNFAYACNNPAACSGGSWMNVTPGVAAPVAVPGSVNMPFDANGNAPFTFSYQDVGAITLSATTTVNGATLAGTTNSFVVKPHNVVVSSVTGNPAAATAAGSVFKKAGEDFELTVTVRNALNQPTHNFGKESPAAQSVTLASTLVLPASGSNPALGNATIAGGGFNNGSATPNNVTWGEVGIITITPNVTDYLGAGGVSGTASGNVGRFTPYDFQATWNTPEFAASCATFTYQGQAFRYAPTKEPVLTATARNKALGTTTNYRGGFFKITNATLTGKAYTAAIGSLDVAAIGGTDPDVVDNANGTASITFDSLTGSSAPAIAFVRPATPTAVFDADISLAINLLDSDGISYAANPTRVGQASAANGIAFSSGNKQMRFGRLRLENGLASSGAVSLPVPIEVQYWDGAISAFRQSSADTCTSLAPADFTLTPSLSGGSTAVSSVTLTGGLGRALLSAPGANNRGSVIVTPSVPAYLKGAWTGATWDEDPSARGSWGVFGSQPRNFIYQRENFQ